MRTVVITKDDFKSKADGYHLDDWQEILEAFGKHDKGINQLDIMPADHSSLQDCLKEELTLNGLNGVMQQVIRLLHDEDQRLSRNLPQDNRQLGNRPQSKSINSSLNKEQKYDHGETIKRHGKEIDQNTRTHR